MRIRLALLGGQALCLGLTSAFLVVSATSVFLAQYGAELLPYAYLVVAAAGVALSWVMTRAQRRLSMARLAETVVASFATLLAAGWAALELAGQIWVTFPLVVLFFLWIPVGFVLVGGQSGRLLDVQQLKAYFPRVAAGFAGGFLVGGLAAARLVTILGEPEDLLLVGALVAVAFLALVVTTAHLHPQQLRAAPAPTDEAPEPAARPVLRTLLADRLVVALLGYQLLSAAVTQLLDFLVWQAAAERYSDPADLARFLGLFGAVINGVGLLFVFGLAGVLMSRYGLRFGLAANPAGVLVLVAVSTVVALAGGQATTAFFVLLCTQQVVDIALTDGTTRGSINAAYQALPPLERFAAQTRVEGVGVPGAVGCVGLLLIVFDRVDAGVLAVLVVVLVLTGLWLWSAVTAYRLYGRDLRRTISRRAWDPVALRLDDPASRAVVDRLLASDDLRDVAVAVDALSASSPAEVLPHLRTLLRSGDPARRQVAVDAALRHHFAAVAPEVLAVVLDRGVPGAVRASATRAYAVLAGDAATLEPLTRESSDEVRASAAVSLLHVRGSHDDVEQVRHLLESDGARSTGIALAALAALPDERAVPPLLRLAARPEPTPGLTEALAAHASHLLEATSRALSEGAPRGYTTRLVRALGHLPGADADEILLRWLGHRDRTTRDVLLRALATRSGLVVRDAAPVRAAVHGEAVRMAYALDALAGLQGSPESEALCRALRDEVDDASERAALLLGLLHAQAVVRRSVAALDGDSRPLALETLEVTLGRAGGRVALALLDPTLSDEARRTGLADVAPVQTREVEPWLAEIAVDPDGRWDEPWLRTCALWSLQRTGSPTAVSVARDVGGDDDPVLVETAQAVLTR